jgi:drug/metabolite transporter (DMT)-like permease
VDGLQGVALGLTAALAWGLTDTVATFASRRVGSLRTTAGTVLVSVAALALLFVVRDATPPEDPAVVLTALACGGIAAWAYLAFYTALRHGPITVVSPVVATYGGLTVVLSVLLLGETPSPGQALGVAVATGGIVLASVAFEGGLRGARPVGPGVAYAVVALVGFAALTVALAGPIRVAGWLPVLLLSRSANAAVVLLILGALRLRWTATLAPAAEPGPARVVTPAPPSPILSSNRPIDRRAVALLVAAGLLDVAGFISFALGLEIAPTWLIGITSSFGPVIAVVAGVALLAERPRPVQWLGLGLVFVSVFLITLG